MSMHRHERTSPHAPLALLLGFALFVVALGYMIAASLARRDAPVFAPSPMSRPRAAEWAIRGDTLTLDATDGDRWQRATLALGRPLAEHDTVRWDVAARRYRITVAGAIADLGAVSFDSATILPSARFVASTATEMENDAMHRWYQYSLVTHLLMPNEHVYALRSVDGRVWKIQPLGYYCPGLTPGCFTFRYAPLDSGAPVHVRGSSADGP
ncbi:MAG TPA: HmuY family protein [Gemmatimonadaceae bacterium]|jgi:hypothetical protein